MFDQLTNEETTVVLAANVTQKGSFLSLAGDAALCLAMTALRLTDAVTVPSVSVPLLQTTPTITKVTKVITLDEVSWHDHISDCWVVVYDSVYNITHFLHEHPGGEEILLEHAGRDATLCFRGIGHGKAMIRALEPYMVGVLPEAERIFTSTDDGSPGSLKLSF